MKLHLVSVLAVGALFSVAGIALAQARLSKTGPGGTSTVRVVCDDAHKDKWPDELADLVRRFESEIILECVATSGGGSGSVSYRDFTWRYKYRDGGPYEFRQSDAYGDFGSVYGDVERVFYFGLPNAARPTVIVLRFDESEGDVVFTTSP